MLRPIEVRAGSISDGDASYRQVAAAIDSCLDGLRALQLWGKDTQLLSSELWNAAGDFLSRGWLQNQARMKPRGYAGDFELLARIYEDSRCDDALGRLFDRYFQEQAAPQAVRNRMRMMSDWIVETLPASMPSLAHVHDSRIRQAPCHHIAVVGSAFGLEAREALGRVATAARTSVRLTLLDLDPAAIDYAVQQLSPLVPAERLTALSTNVFRLPDRPSLAAALKGANLLFCPGLFDYLDDPTAMAMLRLFYASLAPGGRLIVFQFAPHNPTRAYMEWFANWYLTYRDAADFGRLVAAAGLTGAGVTFGAEPLGVDLYVAVTRR